MAEGAALFRPTHWRNRSHQPCRAEKRKRIPPLSSFINGETTAQPDVEFARIGGS
jgi:hypothetical protein